MVSVTNEKEQISKITEVLKGDPYRTDDVVVVINSDQYLVAGEPSLASWMVVMETVKQDAAILLASTTQLVLSEKESRRNFTQEIQEANVSYILTE
ncbi:hypothetical protein SK128_020699 [Halocaridina rubra]|uniref:Uncharacterized protein n=1 Tax=Halocaridina rubra TaxID=373956 RepID=A0AAN8ZNN5_HALRR